MIGASLARRAAALARGVGALALAALFGLSAISQLDALHASRAQIRAKGEPLYLPSATVLRIASVGNRTTMADVVYIWSIQYFGRRVNTRERPYVALIYDRITDLDPHFRDAYWLGFVSLIYEARDPAAAFELADKALANEPDFQLMAIEAALTARRLGDETRAVHYLESARAATGDALLDRLLLRIRTSETVDDELAEWSALLESHDALTRAIAGQHVRDLRAWRNTRRLEALVACFERERGRPPADLAELVDEGFARELPLDSDERAYVYDRERRTVEPNKPYRFKPPSRARRGVDLSDLGHCAPGSGR